MKTVIRFISNALTAVFLATIIYCLAFVLYFGVSYTAFYVFFFRHSEVRCDNLQAISNDKVMVSNLWEQVAMIIEEQAQTETWRPVFPEVSYGGHPEDDHRIDWEALGIPLYSVNILISGKDFSNSESDPRLIDEVRVGYGFRDHLIFTIRDEPGNGGPSEQPPAQWSYDLRVECKTYPGWQPDS